MCQVDIMLVISDSEMNKLIEYNSGTKERGFYTLDKAIQDFNDVSHRRKRYQHYCDEIYDRFVNGRVSKQGENNELQDDLEDNSDEWAIGIQAPAKDHASQKTVQILKGSMANVSNLIAEIEKMKCEIDAEISEKIGS